MTKNDLHEFIKSCMSQEKNIALTENDFTLPFNYVGLDSLTIVVLLCEIEDHFGCDVTLENIDFGYVDTLEKLENYFCEGDND